MFDEIKKYRNNGHFFFKKGDNCVAIHHKSNKNKLKTSKPTWPVLLKSITPG
jgi:hypothetical protein